LDEACSAPAISNFDDALTLARETIALTVAAYALVSGTALDWSLGGWVEATSAQFDSSVVGFTVDPRERLPTENERSDDIRKAATLAVAAEATPSWRLAIRDIYAALQERGDDAFVFAYRAIEDVARAVSGSAGDLRGSDWALLTLERLRRPLGAASSACKALVRQRLTATRRTRN
jgi:hypothetical protein